MKDEPTAFRQMLKGTNKCTPSLLNFVFSSKDFNMAGILAKLDDVEKDTMLGSFKKEYSSFQLRFNFFFVTNQEIKTIKSTAPTTGLRPLLLIFNLLI